MSRVTKSGAPAIPKEYWRGLARAQEEFTSELHGIMRAHLYPLIELEKIGSAGPLADALFALHARHAELAILYVRLAAETKRGRKKAPLLNMLATPQVLAMRNTKRSPGRPAGPDPLSVYREVEQMREKLGSHRSTRSTVVAAVDALNAELARENNWREREIIKNGRASLRSAYNRGKKL